MLLLLSLSIAQHTAVTASSALTTHLVLDTPARAPAPAPAPADVIMHKHHSKRDLTQDVERVIDDFKTLFQNILHEVSPAWEQGFRKYGPGMILFKVGTFAVLSPPLATLGPIGATLVTSALAIGIVLSAVALVTPAFEKTDTNQPVRDPCPERARPSASSARARAQRSRDADSGITIVLLDVHESGELETDVAWHDMHPADGVVS
ncbi:hypothetical protein SeLEV6574_g07873 [Synchytrium endobioticum]|uniref:Uncharacterized protein n=1 Tax=Synchytrium endobioticum TaxID=286115 RepID=A0A507CF51_9FUNG|nr:hypothetical protein SeLEV6574_g07873 [Synchytrium endobioticum]